jgi:pantoate kinase
MIYGSTSSIISTLAKLVLNQFSPSPKTCFVTKTPDTPHATGGAIGPGVFVATGVIVSVAVASGVPVSTGVSDSKGLALGRYVGTGVAVSVGD